MGLCDSSLSSGAFAISGNSLGIPKIQIAIPKFYTIPILGGLFAFRGNYSEGFIGQIPVYLSGNSDNKVVYFHQKSFYGRLGKPEWKLKIYGGFNHQILWCKDLIALSKYSLVKTYLNIVTGKNRYGDSLGSIDIGFDYIFNNLRLFGYPDQ